MRDVENDVDLAKIYPDHYPEKFNIHAETLADSVVGRFSNTLMTLLAAVGLLLFIGCVNVANMLLARATSREKEIAIRSARRSCARLPSRLRGRESADGAYS